MMNIQSHSKFPEHQRINSYLQKSKRYSYTSYGTQYYVADIFLDFLYASL